MPNFIRLAVVLTVMVLLLLTTTTPILANGNNSSGPPEKTTLVASSIGGPANNSVKAPVAMVPDKSTHPVHGAAKPNPAFGGEYLGPGSEGTPGKVF